MKRKLIGFYNYTVILTYFGLASALFGITRIFTEDFTTAVLCLMLAGFCDMFDGAIAATRKRTVQEKRFGIQIDSLCDLVCFGVMPALFVYSIFGKGVVVSVIACIYVLCAVIRLAYYNVTEEERQDETDERRENYLGVPVTTIALLLPALLLINILTVFKSTLIFPIFLAITAVGFIAPVKIKKPHNTGKMILLAIGLVELIAIILATIHILG